MNACRSANLRAVLYDEATLKVVEEFVKKFNTIIGGDRRGSRLSDLRNPSQHLQVLGRQKLKVLEAPIFSALLAHSMDPDDLAFRHPPDQHAYTYNKLVISGTQFQTRSSLPADSYIICERQGAQHCGRIESIFLPPGQEDTATVLLAVKRYIPLSEEDRKKDPYQLWGFSGGELFYDRFHEDYLIIQLEEVIGHIAKTSLGRVFGIDTECIHVLPLDQVAFTFFTIPFPAYNSTAQVRRRSTKSSSSNIRREMIAVFRELWCGIVVRSLLVSLNMYHLFSRFRSLSHYLGCPPI